MGQKSTTTKHHVRIIRGKASTPQKRTHRSNSIFFPSFFDPIAQTSARQIAILYSVHQPSKRGFKPGRRASLGYRLHCTPVSTALPISKRDACDGTFKPIVGCKQRNLNLFLQKYKSFCVAQSASRITRTGPQAPRAPGGGINLTG